MKYYNRRVLFTYSHYGICPYVTFELDKEYSEEELKAKTIEAAIKFQDDEDIEMIKVTNNRWYKHQGSADTITIFHPAKITDDKPTSLFWQDI